GSVGTGATPTHTYTAAGLYNVSLTVTDNDGLTGTATTTANIGAVNNPDPVLNGLELYNTNCASCHGAAPGTKAGRSFAQIKSAIGVVQAMASISLTDAEIQAVSDAIANNGGGGGGQASDGEGLYNSYCASCHGVGGEGGVEEAVTGETADSIKDAINGEADMNYLTALITDAEIDLIAAYLNGESGGGSNGMIEVSKESIYDQYCLACHGAEGRGGAEEDVRGSSLSSIQSAIDSETDMNYLSGLSEELLQAITDFLNGDNGSIMVPDPGAGGSLDGLALYNLNCSGCHGNAPGAKAGRSSAEISAAISNVGVMNGLSGLTQAELDAIAIAIGGSGGSGGGGSGGGGTPPDGAQLYADNCAGCHGTAPGAKADRTAAEITAAIGNVASMNGLSLTAAEIDAIAAAIFTGGGGGSGGGGSGGGGNVPLDGAQLYADNCASCHGSAPGSKAGRSADQIQTAINGVPAMNGLSGLTVEELAAIATAIGGGNVVVDTSPAGLYATYCAACHGAEGRGGAEGDVRGASAGEIRSAISGETAMNYLDALLADSTIDDIASYLNDGNNQSSDESDKYDGDRRDRDVAGEGGAASADGGGGCTVRKGALFDPVLPLLILMSIIYLLRRVRINS
ncbi:MAG: c-type cytochrome, partial [Gammaproteobacteria bacterium]|nr:c-type cytochrome [Gammaproteobacteria bacterium]